METNAASRLIARLIACRYLPRDDDAVKQLLVDAAFRADVEERLAACGMRLLDQPFADHVAVALAREVEDAVFFETGTVWQSSNIALSKDAVAVLVLLWALIILPKRERQLARESTEAPGQNDMFGGLPRFPVRHAEDSHGIAEATFLDDYAKRLGGKGRLTQFILPQLARLGFIERRNKVLYEGPLLDLAFDYAEMAPRILQGALADLLRGRKEAKAAAEQIDSNDAAEPSEQEED